MSQTTQKNPFLSDSHFPEFNLFHVEHIEPAVSQLLADNKKVIDELVSSEEQPTWQNFVEPLEAIDNRFEKVWGPVGHLDAVMNSDEWHNAYTNCLEKVTQYYTENGQNEGLYQMFHAISKGDEYHSYNLAQKKVIENALRNFRLSGIALPKPEQAIYKELKQRLSQNSSQFGNNVLKSTQAWSKHINDESQLAGLPESAMGLLQQLAEQKSLTGWLVTLDFPSYLAIMT
ncbi:MAG: oligopeptidase A, partial [Thiomicrorhabdus sp.]|nr:oligopeptidase A [Thiomicrorhabdus sp.]